MQHVFVSHGHLDHCGAIVSHARLRALSLGAPAKYYMSAELAAGMEKVNCSLKKQIHLKSGRYTNSVPVDAFVG